jgi:hypothetical protein
MGTEYFDGSFVKRISEESHDKFIYFCVCLYNTIVSCVGT